MESDFVTVARMDDLPGVGGVELSVEGRTLAIFKTESGVFATESMCPHRGGRLFAGWVEQGKVYCPMHGWDFDLRTGACGSHPEQPIKCFETRVIEGNLQVRLAR